MALPKRATNVAKPAAAKPVAAEPEAADNVINSVVVSRGMTISMGEFSGIKIGATVSASGPDAYETASEAVEEILNTEAEKANIQFSTLTGREPGDDDTTSTEGADDAGGGEGDDEPGLTAEDVQAMKRSDLETLVTENELAIDPDEFPKNAKGLAAFRDAVVEAAFGDDAGEGEAAEGEGEATDGDETEISEDTINAMDRPTLVKFIKDNTLDVNPAKLTKLADLRAAVITALTPDEDAATDDSGDEATGDDEVTEYTEEMLTEYKIEDLKAIYAEWDMGKFPAGPPPKAKKTAIAAILAAQAG